MSESQRPEEAMVMVPREASREMISVALANTPANVTASNVQELWRCMIAATQQSPEGWQDISTHDGSDTPVDLWRDGERLIDYRWSGRRWQKEHGYPSVTTVLMTAPSHFMPAPPPPVPSVSGGEDHSPSLRDTQPGSADGSSSNEGAA